MLSYGVFDRFALGVRTSVRERTGIIRLIRDAFFSWGRLISTGADLCLM
jgi:hypothetical protein